MANGEEPFPDEQNSVILDDNDVILTSAAEIIISEADESQRNAFNSNVEQYRSTLSSSMREKSMITTELYNTIISALRCGKGGKKAGIDIKFYAWCKTHFRIVRNADTDILCSVKQNTRIAVVENYFQILKDAHVKTGHGGRDKMRHEVGHHYYWLPSKVIDAFLPTCVSCQVRKPLKSHVIPTAIISLGFLTRLQMDLIDMRTRPDREYKWILHCRDHFTKYSWGFAVPTKEAHHVAENLLKIFFQFGPCKILQSDNGKEFTAQIIKDLKSMWPGLVILNGRPRHPQSQGLVERGNSTLCDILGKLMHDRDTNHWVSCLGPAIYAMNTSIAQGIKHTPFEVVFGQKPRVDATLWQSIAEGGIENEDDLPSSIRDQLDEALIATIAKEEGPIVSPSSRSNIDPINEQSDLIVKKNCMIEENASSSPSSLTTDPMTTNISDDQKDERNVEFDESSTSNLGFDELPHMSIRKKAAATYLSRTTSLQNAHRTRLQSLREKCNVGEYVALRIDKVDRTNTDPKLLPCVVIEQKDNQAKLACVYGILNQWWPLDILIGISAVPNELVDLKLDDLSEISMITASKLYVRGAVNGVCCSCKGGCKTKQCACKRNLVFCSTKCHKNVACCENMEK